MGEQDTNGALLVPVAESGGVGERRVVALEGPYPPAQARDHRPRSFLENREGVAAKQPPEGLVGRGAGDPPADQAAQCQGVGQPYVERRAPKLVGIDQTCTTMVGPDSRIREPVIEARKSHSVSYAYPSQEGHTCG